MLITEIESTIDLEGPEPYEHDSKIHKYILNHESTPIGYLYVANKKWGRDPDYAEHLELSIYPLVQKGPPLKLSYSQTRSIVQQLSQLYPYAKAVGGIRQTGVHSKQENPYTWISLGAAHTRRLRQALADYMAAGGEDKMRAALAKNLSSMKSGSQDFE